MKIIVACDKNWAIGKDNHLLVSIPNDMKRFREITTGNVVVMGRKTYESFPGNGPLENRVNIILTKNPSYTAKGASVVHSIDELMDAIAAFPTDNVYVIGGSSIYEQLLNMCDTALVTKIDYTYEADAFFPNLDEMQEWEIVSESEEITYFDLEYTFVEYKRILK